MTLVVLAAGLGSRYGGESKKQIDIIGENGEILMDYSIFDAMRAGFDHIVLLIKRKHAEIFREKVCAKFEGKIKVDLAFQDDDAFCGAYAMPEERKKPWGTGHALLCCRDAVGNDNFAVVNADDFYGYNAYRLAYEHLSHAKKGEYAMIGYLVRNTVTDEGGVSRGVCVVSPDGYLKHITETHEITKGPDYIYYPTPSGNVKLEPDTVVSMNFFCFTPDFFGILERGFGDFLQENESNLNKCEFYIPLAVQTAIDEGEKLRVYSTPDKWFGVTYITDKPVVIEGIAGLTDAGLYPRKLW